MPNFGLNTDKNQITGTQGTGTNCSIDTATGVLSCQEGTNTFASDSDVQGRFWDRRRKIYLYNDDDLFIGESVVAGKLANTTEGGNTIHNFELVRRKDVNGDSAFFLNENGINRDDDVDTTNYTIELSGHFADLDWGTDSEGALNPSDADTLYTFRVKQSNSTISTSSSAQNYRASSDASSLRMGDTTDGHNATTIFMEDVIIRSTWDSTNKCDAGPWRRGSGTFTFGWVLDYSDRSVRGGISFELVHDTDGDTNDKSFMSYIPDVNSSASERNVVEMYYGCRFWGNASRFRLFGQEGTDWTDANDCNNAVLLVMKCFFNQDIYTRTGADPFVSAGAAISDGKDYSGYGGKDQNLLIDCVALGSAANAIPCRWGGTISGGDIKYYNSDDADAGPLASLGFRGGGGSTPREIGAAGNTYLEMIQKSISTDTNNEQAYLNRVGGSDATAFLNFTNVNSLDRRGRYDTEGGTNNRVSTNTRIKFEYAGRWHNLADNTDAWVTYDTDNTGLAGYHGWVNTLWNNPGKIDVDNTTNQLDIRIVDAIHKARTNDVDGFTTTTYGYRYPNVTGTDGTDEQDDSYFNGDITYSIKCYGYNDILVDSLSRTSKVVSGTTIQSWEVSANVENSLGGGLPGGIEQSADENISLGFSHSDLDSSIEEDNLANKENIVAMMGTIASGQYPYFSAGTVNSSGEVAFTLDNTNFGNAEVRTWDELYACLHRWFAEPPSTALGEAHHIFPWRTVSGSTDLVWDLTDAHADSAITETNFTISSNWVNGNAFSANNSRIQGIKIDGDVAFEWWELVDFRNNTWLETGDTYKKTSTQSWSDVNASWDAYIPGVSHNAFQGDHPFSEDRPAGKFHLFGRVDIDIITGHTDNEFNLYFEGGLDEDDYGLYAAGVADTADSQAQIRVNFADNNGTLYVHGLNSTRLFQTGADKAFHTTGTGSSIQFRKDTVFRFVDPDRDGTNDTAADSDGADWSIVVVDEDGTVIAHSHFEDINTSTNTDAADLSFTIHTDNTHTFTVNHDATKTISVAAVYKQADGRSYRVAQLLNFNDDRYDGLNEAFNLIRINEITATGKDTAFPDDVIVTALTSAVSDTNKLTVKFDLASDSAASSVGDQETRWYLANAVTANTSVLQNIAQEYLPSYIFDFGPSTTALHEDLFNTTADPDVSRIVFELNDGNTAAPWHLQSQLLNSGEGSVWNLVTTTTGNKKIYFEPKSTGATIGSISAELDNRDVKASTWQSVSRLKYKAP